MTTRSERNSNLELLRIIVMFLIITHHWAVHGFDYTTFVLSNPNTFFIYFLTIFGKFGVDVFILISSYFMINHQFTFKKFLIIEGESYFYSILILLLFLTILTPANPIGINDILMSILPISHSAHGFITKYVILMILSPFLNKFIKGLTKKEFLMVLFIMIILWSIFPTFTFAGFEYNDLIWFIVLYFIGSFIRLYVDINKLSNKKLILIFTISLLVSYLSYMLFCSIGLLINNKSLLTIAQACYLENNIFILISSLSLLLIFLKRKNFSNKYINFISGSMLGVLLIHDNLFVRKYLWKILLNNPSHYFSNDLIIFALISSSSIFIICILIDIIRRITIEKLWIHIIDTKLLNLPKRFYNIFERFYNKIENYLNKGTL